MPEGSIAKNPFVVFLGRGSFAGLSAQGCSQPRAGLAIVTPSRFTVTLLDFSSPMKGLPIIFFRKEQKGLMERTWQGSGLLLLSTDYLKLKFPLRWLPTCKIKRHCTRSLCLTGLHAELYPCSPADNNLSPISDFASHGYPTQRASKREGLINQRSPLQLTSRIGFCNLKAD